LFSFVVAIVAARIVFSVVEIFVARSWDRRFPEQLSGDPPD
jgi:hypothetical protein